MYSGIIAVSFLGLALFKLIDVLENRFCSWQKLSEKM
jgi:NitT/TauT family transport system permease protein